MRQDAPGAPKPAQHGTPLQQNAEIPAGGRLGGLTAGEHAEQLVRRRTAANRELSCQRDRLRSEEITRLREHLDKSTTYGPRYTGKSALFHAVRRISGLRGHRITKCLTFRAPGAEIEVHGAGDGRAKYVGVAVCGNAWACPTCAPRISERHRLELKAAADAHRAAGGALALSSFTFSHHAGMPLREAWQRLSKALQRFARHATVKRVRKRFGWCGRVRARETTFGINGWHPHAHTLEFFGDARTGRPPPSDLDMAEVLPELKQAWQDCCRAVGLDCSLAHGFDMSLTDVDDYIAKWGSDAELTKWHMKRGRVGEESDERGLWGYTPFDLLRIFAGVFEPDPRLKLTPYRAAALYTEFVKASHGTAQLHWSRGLKDALLVDEQADEAEPEYRQLGTVSAAEWAAITDHGYQLLFLGLAAESWELARAALARWTAMRAQDMREDLAVAARTRGPP